MLSPASSSGVPRFAAGRSHPLARPSGSRFARRSPPIRFAHLRCIFGRYNRPCPSRKQSKPNPPKCAIHRHPTPKPCPAFAGERGRSPRSLCFPTARQIPVFCRGPLAHACAPFGFSLRSNVPSDSLRSSSVHFRAAIIVPAPREASERVSRSNLLGSELKSSKPVLPV